MQGLTKLCFPLFKNLTACAEDFIDSFRGDSTPSLSGENRLLRLLPESAAIELRLLESDNSVLSSSLFLLACQESLQPLLLFDHYFIIKMNKKPISK